MTIILVIAAAIIVAVFLINSNNSRNVSNANVEGNINQSIASDWRVHISDRLGITVSYPQSWDLNEFNDELDNYVEIKSDEDIQYTDELSGQIIQAPLSTITIREDELPADTNMEVWARQRVNSDSVQTQEQYSLGQYPVIRQWVWNKQNVFAFSSINYYIQVGTNIISFRNTIMNEDPSLDRFISAEKMGDEIFNSLEIK